MKNKLLLSVMLCTVMLALLPGCATNPAAAAAKAGLRTVTLDSHIDAREGMRYGLDNYGYGFGLVGIIAETAANNAKQKDVNRMGQVMQANNINLPDMIRAEATRQLREHPGLQFVDGPADGTFLVSIVQYGFKDIGIATSKKAPYIILAAELRDNQGKRVWRCTQTDDAVTSEGLRSTWDQYEVDPEKLRADWALQISRMLKKTIPVD